MSRYRCWRCHMDFDESHDFLAHDEWCSKNTAPALSRDEIALRFAVVLFGSAHAEYDLTKSPEEAYTEVCVLAYHLADLFIKAGKEGK